MGFKGLRRFHKLLLNLFSSLKNLLVEKEQFLCRQYPTSTKISKKHNLSHVSLLFQTNIFFSQTNPLHCYLFSCCSTLFTFEISLKPSCKLKMCFIVLLLQKICSQWYVRVKKKKRSTNKRNNKKEGIRQTICLALLVTKVSPEALFCLCFILIVLRYNTIVTKKKKKRIDVIWSKMKDKVNLYHC